MMKITRKKTNNPYKTLKSALFLKLIFFFVLYSYQPSKGNQVTLPNFGFICIDKNKTNQKFEFIFSRNENDTEDIVFRRIDGKFQYIGIVLAKKQGAYVLWEDKIFFRTTDFGWLMDKVTSTLKPIILSVGNKLESFEKLPEKMTCNSRSIYF